MTRTRTILTIIFSLLTAVALSAAVHTVDDIPNVHVADAHRYVSDPDGLLSPAMRDSLDAAIRRVWETSSAELVVVVVDRIEGGDIDSFATELFTRWGIGKEDNDNGVLYIVALGDRRAAIRTGYGSEGVVPDVLAGRIIRSSNLRFKEGDVDGGVADAVGQLGTLLTTPGATEELMSKYSNDRRRDNGDERSNLFGMWLSISAIIATGMLVWLIVALVETRKDGRYKRYMRLQQMQLPALVVSFATIGMGLVAFIPLMIIMRRLRTASRKCPNCSAKMHRLDEKADNAYLTPAQDTEERLNSVDYDVWLCPQCGETDILPYVNHSKSYTQCPRCGARACTMVADRVISRPTESTEGRGAKVYQCLNCRNTNAIPYTIPKLPPVIIVPPLGGRGGGFGGGGFSGGSFGGGSTGGGGASGGW